MDLDHSTSHALINTTEFIKEKLDSGSHIGGIFIDLEKAFDIRLTTIYLLKSYITMDLQELVNNLYNLSSLTATNMCLFMALILPCSQLPVEFDK